jgi:molybdate transport system permease protein
MDYSPLRISLQTAALSTVFTLILGLAAAGLVCRMKHCKSLIDSIFSLPLVLPPTVVGFLLLIAFGKNSALGYFMSAAGFNVVFTAGGAVLASVIVSFPVMYRTIRGAIEQVDENLANAARTLGLSEFTIFVKIIMPEAKPGIIAAILLSFARALGEFGATIMVAGNIPGRTQTMSVAVYTAMQSGNRDLAFKWVMIILAISMVTLCGMNLALGRGKKPKRKKINEA